MELSIGNSRSTGLRCVLCTVPYTYEAVQKKYIRAYFVSGCVLFSVSYISPQIYRPLEEMTKHFDPNQRLHFNCLLLNHKKLVLQNNTTSEQRRKLSPVKRNEKVSFIEAIKRLLAGERVVTECYLG